jgi:hypothetical protein
MYFWSRFVLAKTSSYFLLIVYNPENNLKYFLYFDIIRGVTMKKETVERGCE